MGDAAGSMNDGGSAFLKVSASLLLVAVVLRSGPIYPMSEKPHRKGYHLPLLRRPQKPATKKPAPKPGISCALSNLLKEMPV